MHAYFATVQPRRKQTPITIRSDRAAARLKLLTRDGRSQAEVIEEALDRLGVPTDARKDIDARMAELDALVAKIPKGSILSMKEFDALEYDENGDLR
jgi:antitoxin VapB